MKRQFLAVTLMAALAAVPVRADDSLLYLAGRPVDSQMGSDQLRDRLKEFLSRSESVSAPIRRTEQTQDVAALSVEITVHQEDTTPLRVDMARPHKDVTPAMSETLLPPEEILLPPEVKVAALTIDPFAAPIPVAEDDASQDRVPDHGFTDLVPEETVLPPETQVAALPVDALHAPVPAMADTMDLSRVLDRDGAIHVPEETVLPTEIQVAALPADALHAPVPAMADTVDLSRVLDRDGSIHVPEEIVLPTEIRIAALTAEAFHAPVPERPAHATLVAPIELALPAAERAVDGAQVAHFSVQDRSVVFDDGNDAIVTLGLAPKAVTQQSDAAFEPLAEVERPLAAASEGLTQVAAAGPVQLVPQPSADADIPQTAQSGSDTPTESVLPPRPLPKPDRGYTQLAALSTGPAPATQAISIDGRGKPLSIQAGKGRMLRLPEAVDTVFVAQPEIADIQMKSPRLLYLFGRQPGETTIYATTKDDTVVLNQRIQVAHNLDPLNELIQAVHPESIIEVRSLNNTVVLTGLVPDVATAENIFQLAGQVLGENGRVMNRIKVAGVNQVNLRVRVAEVRREISKQLGFNWDVLRTTGSLAIGFATAGFGSITSATSNVITTEATLGSLDVNSVIDALDDEGLISVLAEPNLTAMNGEVANFLAGGEFPIPIAQGDDTISITFKQFGVSLSFSPQVLEKGRINIKVLTEVSQLSQAGAVQVSGFSVPALTTRRAETTVELRSGQSFAIAGLLQNVINQSIEEFPGLADLPIIGPLFKSEEFQRDETELLVVVTPYLVRPTNAQIALPMDGYVPPTDTERFLRQTNRPRVPDNNSAPRDRGGRPGSVGEAGFIVR